MHSIFVLPKGDNVRAYEDPEVLDVYQTIDVKQSTSIFLYPCSAVTRWCSGTARLSARGVLE